MTETTPRGREVHPLVGSADAIAAEGMRLLRTGDLMDETARWFEGIEHSTVVGKGFSIDALREDAGSARHGFTMVATRYRESGKTVNLYAEAFGELQPLFEPIPGELAELRVAEEEAGALLEEVHELLAYCEGQPSGSPIFFDVPPRQPATPFAVPLQLVPDRLPAVSSAGEMIPPARRTAQLLSEYLHWADGEITRLLGLYDAHYDAWEAAVAAYAQGLVVAADPPATDGWGGGGVTDTWGENWYQMFDTIASGAGQVGVAADLATAGGAVLSATGWGAVLGVPLATEAVVVSSAAGCVEWIASAGKVVLTTGGHVRRVDGQAGNDWFGLGMATVGLLPFDGIFKAKGWADIDADGAGGMLGAIFGVSGDAIDLGTSTDPIDTWRTSMQDQPYVPPPRVPGRPWTTTVAPPIPYQPR